MNNTKQTIDNHNKRILNSSKPFNDTANNTNTKDTKTCSCQQKNTCPLNGNCLQSSLIYQATVTCKDNSTLKCTSDLQKMTSRLDTETTPHHSNTKSTETLPNSANISGPLKKIKLTTLFYGTSFHQDHPTTTQAKDATSASKKNYLSSTTLNYNHSQNVTKTCPHTTTETNNYCVTIEKSIEISRHAFMQVCTVYK